MINAGAEKRLAMRMKESRLYGRLYCWSCGLSQLDPGMCKNCPLKEYAGSDNTHVHEHADPKGRPGSGSGAATVTEG